jgi:transcriptional regulator with XRE-family HTH domain
MEFLTDDLVDTARDAVRAKAREVMGRERWTYEEVAARARVGKATVTRFLNGDPRSHRYWPREEQIKSLSEGFGFDIEAELSQEIAQGLVEKLGAAVGDGQATPHDTLLIDFGPDAFEGLSRQDILEVSSAAELAGLRSLAEVRARRREPSPALPRSA